MSDLVVARPPTQRRAIICVCGASALFVLAAAAVKAVAREIPVMEIVLFRSLVAMLVLLPLLRKQGGFRALRTTRPLGHLARTLCGFIGMFTSFYGYAALPLATVTALNFAMPLCLAVLSVPLLGERVGPKRAAAVVAGLAGVLIILRPWQEGEAGALPLLPVVVVLIGVVAWALAMISIRRMGALGERNVAIVLWFSLGSTIAAALLSIPVWVTPVPLVLLGLCSVGAISAAAQMLMTEGYRAGEPTLVAPFEYGAILYSTLIGVAIWGEMPDIWSLLGITVLIGAGLAVWRSA